MRRSETVNPDGRSGRSWSDFPPAIPGTLRFAGGRFHRVRGGLFAGGDLGRRVVQRLQVLLVILAGDQPSLDVPLDGADIEQALGFGIGVSGAAHGWAKSYHNSGRGQKPRRK